MNRASYLLLLLNVLFLGYGIYFLGLIHPHQLVLKVPSEGTPPADFDVVFGRFKLGAMKPDSLTSIAMETCCVETINKADVVKDWDGYDDHYYIIEVEMIGTWKDDPDSTFVYPLLKATQWKKVLDVFVWVYWAIECILLFTMVWNLTKGTKGTSEGTQDSATQ